MRLSCLFWSLLFSVLFAGCMGSEGQGPEGYDTQSSDSVPGAGAADTLRTTLADLENALKTEGVGAVETQLQYVPENLEILEIPEDRKSEFDSVVDGILELESSAGNRQELMSRIEELKEQAEKLPREESSDGSGE